MLSLFKHALSSHIQRVGSRSVASVVPDAALSDFGFKNEPIKQYLKDSDERKELLVELEKLSCDDIEEIPIIIGGEEIKTDCVRYQVMPSEHKKKIARFYYATPNVVQRAIDCAVESQKKWDQTPLDARLKIWEKAADLMATKYRQSLNAATMLGQGKSVIQAEIDSACELIDFFRMNCFFLKENAKYQPISENVKVTRNSLRYRGIDGFVAAITPFNFTAIGGNLAYTPALMGNGMLWKPSDTAMLSNWRVFQICREAGVPEGVVNFVPADGPVFGDAITQSPYLAAINFTGSVPTFQRLWRQVGENIENYKNFPRLIGECGGKNFHFIHPSADCQIETIVAGTIRSAFEYCGQKCSACSRMYVPESLWPKIKPALLEERKKLSCGDPRDFSIFMSAVIDEKAFKRITGYIDYAKDSSNLKILGGGGYDVSKGYFIEPTIIETCDPLDRIMREEIFGPVLTIYVYKDSQVKETMKMCATSTPFALTGSIFGQDEKFLKVGLEAFKMSAGNFYINDKSTGSVVGQQPFGGGRMSGTNDKAGGPQYVLRWTTPQAIKETFVPIPDIDYPYMRC